MNAPTDHAWDTTTGERLLQAVHAISGERDLANACTIALQVAIDVTGAVGGEVVTSDDGLTMVPRARAGVESGAHQATVWELPGTDGPVGRLSVWGASAGSHPAVAIVVAQLALVVRNVLLERRSIRQREQSRRLAGAMRALRDVHPTEQAVLCLLKEAQQMAAAAGSALVTGLAGDPGPLVSVGVDPAREKDLLDLVTGEARGALDVGAPYSAPLPASSPLRSAGVVGYAAVAVGGPQERIGTLVLLTRDPRGMGEDMLSALVGLADHATTALGAAALRERLNDLATVDPGTRFFNDRYFSTRIEQETHRALRNGDTLSLLVVRMDGLDQLRATAGNGTAEKAVNALAEFMVPRLRATDIGCRTAPNEFALILPSAAGLDAFLIGERIRAGFAPDASLGWGVSLSVGVATFPDPAGTADQLDAFAHAAVEYARRNGGDRVFLYDREVAAGLDAADQRERIAAESLMSTITNLAAAIDERHPSTRLHSQNVARIAALLAEELEMPGDQVENVRLAGLLHDVGKIGVTDELLVRPGPLNDEEWAEMRQHPEMAYRMLSGGRLEGVRDWVRAHNERPDGSGYPRGLTAEHIPLEAGILAVANALDAMTNDRPYRAAMAFPDAIAEIRAGSGTQFMPRVVDVLLGIVDRDETAIRPNEDAP